MIECLGESSQIFFGFGFGFGFESHAVTQFFLFFSFFLFCCFCFVCLFVVVLFLVLCLFDLIFCFFCFFYYYYLWLYFSVCVFLLLSLSLLLFFCFISTSFLTIWRNDFIGDDGRYVFSRYTENALFSVRIFLNWILKQNNCDWNIICIYYFTVNLLCFSRFVWYGLLTI